jgi:hypothetical protein
MSVRHYKVVDSFGFVDVAISYNHEASELSVLGLLLAPLTINQELGYYWFGRVSTIISSFCQ